MLLEVQPALQLGQPVQGLVLLSFQYLRGSRSHCLSWGKSGLDIGKDILGWPDTAFFFWFFLVFLFFLFVWLESFWCLFGELGFFVCFTFCTSAVHVLRSVTPFIL